MNNQKNPKYWITKTCELCGKEFQGLISKNPRFCSNVCSSTSTAKSLTRIQKIKKTKLERYGSETYVNPDKAKLTCLEKYGVTNVSKSDDIKKKIIANNDYVAIAKKTREKCRMEYGVDWISNRKDVKEKKIETCQKNFGVDNPFQSAEIQKKIKQTYENKFGPMVDHPSKSETIKQLKVISYKNSFYEVIITTHKLNSVAIPLFTKDEYINTDRSHLYKFRCKTCNSEFFDHIDGGHIPRCWTCNPMLQGKSGMEIEVSEYIKTIYNGEIITGSRKILPSGLELDIYIPDKKLAVEIDGLYWHSELAGKHKHYHLDKTIECEKLGIQLIHIFEDEWKNKLEIIKEKLKSKLCAVKHIGARKLSVKSITSTEKNKFLRLNHIQGSDNSSYSIGGFNGNELVAVATFSKPRIALGNKNRQSGTFELSRFATSIPIVGILPKMLKYFGTLTECKKIISYADRRFASSLHNIYNSIGFTLIGETPVNYWYFQTGYFDRYHRFGYTKSNLKTRLSKFDPTKTEWQNMVDNGWNRIWDCGNFKYEYNF